MLVDRSYGSRVVEAVVDNQADFGITQLPVKEKRLQVVKIHSDEIKVIVPAGSSVRGKKQVLTADLMGEPLLLPKGGTTRSRLDGVAGTGGGRDQHLDGARFHRDDQAFRAWRGLGVGFLAATHCREEVAAGRLAAISLGPDPMVRQVGLIYRKDKALSKAALGFIEVVLEHAASVGGVAFTACGLRRSRRLKLYRLKV